MNRFSLLCHPATPGQAVRSVTVALGSLTPETVTLRYELDAEMEAIVLPVAAAGHFQDGLWRHTCFELFVANSEQNRQPTLAYSEFNFSPSCSWAAYDFSNYRAGKRPLDSDEGAGLAPRISRRVSGLDVELSTAILLRGSMTTLAMQKLALTAVIEERSGTVSYWALKHCQDKPDFHDRESFTATWPTMERTA